MRSDTHKVSLTWQPKHELDKDTNRHSKEDRKKLTRAQSHTKNLRHAQSGRQSSQWKCTETGYPILNGQSWNHIYIYKLILDRLGGLYLGIYMHIHIHIYIYKHIITINENGSSLKGGKE